MRILYITNYYKPAYVYGGPVNSISSLCEGLAKLGEDVTVFTTNANGRVRLEVPLSQRMDVKGVKVWYFPLTIRGSYSYSYRLSQAVSHYLKDFDVVVVESLWGHSFHPTVQACKRFQKPFVVPLRGQLQPWAMNHSRLKKKIYFSLITKKYLNQANALHCTDNTEKKSVELLGINVPVFVIPNGIDTSKYINMPPRGKLRKQLGIPSDAAVMLFMGRITRIKRADITIETLAQIKSLNFDAHLIIAGPDEDGLTESLLAKANELGCSENVHLTGLLRNKDLLYAFSDADIFLMPSEIQENFGMSALEALAAGVPVLVSEGVPVGRYAEIAGAGLVLPTASEAFARAAVGLLEAPSKINQMRECGIELARQMFDTSVISKDMLSQYISIVETGRPLNNISHLI